MDTEARRRSCRAWTEKPLFKEAKTTTDTCTERKLGGISSDDDIGENVRIILVSSYASAAFVQHSHPGIFHCSKHARRHWAIFFSALGQLWRHKYEREPCRSIETRSKQSASLTFFFNKLFFSPASIASEVSAFIQTWRSAERRHKRRADACRSPALESDNCWWGRNVDCFRFIFAKTSTFRVKFKPRSQSNKRDQNTCTSWIQAKSPSVEPHVVLEHLIASPSPGVPHGNK